MNRLLMLRSGFGPSPVPFRDVLNALIKISSIFDCSHDLVFFITTDTVNFS